MKKIISLALVTAAVSILGGCAGLPTVGLPPDRVQVVDYQKMNLIDEYAKRTGMTVIWVRQPTRTVDKVATAGS